MNNTLVIEVIGGGEAPPADELASLADAAAVLANSWRMTRLPDRRRAAVDGQAVACAARQPGTGGALGRSLSRALTCSVPRRAYEPVLAELARAIRCGDEPDRALLAELIRAGTSHAPDQWVARCVEQLVAAATRHRPLTTLAAVLAALVALTTSRPAGAPCTPPPRPLADVHALAAPAPANAPPHRDLPTLREVAA